MILAQLAPAPLPLELAGDRDLEAIGVALRGFFESWKRGRTVTGLVATGPVPNFAPPYCPVDCVTGGEARAPPGAIR